MPLCFLDIQPFTPWLVPYVESHYKTSPFRVLIGHSFGGIFAVNALRKYPDEFNAYIIISPSLWWSKDTLVNQISAFLEKTPKMRTFVCETIGNEGPGMVTPSLRVQQAIENYEKSIVLNPNNTAGIEVLKKLKSKENDK